MKLAKIISALGLLAMTAVITYGFIIGDFSKDGAQILSNPWGIVSLVDLYVGFILFSMWIAFREEKVPVAVIWIVLMMILGFFTAALYILINLFKYQDDWPGFFMGHRKQ